MCKFVFTERPAFTQFGEFKLSESLDGYTLQLDVDHMTASIINLKKGGNRTMAVKTITKAKEGWEELYDKVVAMRDNLEAEKEEAIKVAIADVESKFVARADEIAGVFAQVSVTEEIEVPDEEEPVVTEEAQPEVAETLY